MASLVNAETIKKTYRYYHHHSGLTKTKTTKPLFHLRHYYLWAALEYEAGEEADSADPIAVYVQKTRCYQASAIK